MGFRGLWSMGLLAGLALAGCANEVEPNAPEEEEIAPAPMFLVTGPDLVAAAAEARIVGVAASSSTRTPDEYDDWLGRIEERLKAFRARTGRATGPVAANVGAPSRRRGDTPRYVRDLEFCRKRRIPLVITVKGDPTADIKLLQNIGFVMKCGRVYKKDGHTAME